MTEEQHEQWRKALKARAARQRRLRYQPRKSIYNIRGPGMVRIPPPQPNRRTA
jgi:hypothetical protein